MAGHMLSSKYSMNDFYCAAIHHNIRLDTTPDSQVKVLPCCVYKTDKHYQTLEQYYASAEIQELQAASDWPKGCENCQQQEAQGQTSYRNHANAALKNVTGVRYEIMPSNVCNLKCVMCSPPYSTALATERHSIGIESVDLSRETNTSKEQLALLTKDNNIESISAIGGEFFLTKGNLEIMDFVISRNIPFRAVTNATVLLDSHLERLKKISMLELQISIDGRKQGYEIMRYPADWKTFENNVSRLIKELPNASINFHFVAQALNVQQLVPTLDWCNRQRRSTRVTNLVQPKHLNWAVFSEQERNNVIKLLKDQCQRFQITQSQQELVKNLCNTILAVAHDPETRQQFESTVGKLYQHRWPDLTESNSQHPVRNHVFYPLD